MTEPDASNNGMPTPITGSQVPRRAPDRRRRNGGPGHGLGDVDALMAAATDRAHPRELAGEEAAVAAFRAAHRLSAGRSPRRRPLVPVPGFLVGSLAVKIAISLGVVSLGGVAYAAEIGSLPGPAQSAAHRLLGAVGVPDAGEHASDQAGQQTQSHADGPRLEATSPAVTGLCRAFAAGEKDEHGKGLDGTAFQALATAAGGQDKIEAFCADVLAGPSASPSAVPSSTPSAVPSQSQTNPEPTPAAPSGSAAPTEPPTPTHPTGPPTDLPTPTEHGKP
jgi:hypothetical protein